MGGLLLRLTTVLVTGIAGVFAQSGSSLPTLGLLFDASGKTLRPVWGIPGSAFYGAPLDLGFPISQAVITPGQDAAIVSTPESIYLVRVKSSGVASQRINGAAGNPGLLVLSPRGEFGATYYADRQIITIMGRLASDAPEARDINATALGGKPDALAVSDDGRLLIALVSTGGDSPVTDVITVDTQSGDTRRILGTPHGAAVGFLPGATDAVFADDVSGSVFLVRDVPGAAQQTVLLSGEARLTAPSGLQVAPDGKRVLAVSATSGSLGMIDLAGGDPAFLNCKCQPSGVRSLSGNVLFQIAPLRDGVAWIVEWDPANPRILFIPPEFAYAGAE